MKLNLGCGEIPMSGYINIDIEEGVGVDYVCDIRNLPYPDESIDEIMMIHSIEHFTLRDAKSIFKKCHRMLVNGGKLHVEGPDVYSSVKMSPTEEEAIQNIFGCLKCIESGHTHQQHLWGWTANTMQRELEKIGFCITEVGFGKLHYRPWRDYRVVGMK